MNILRALLALLIVSQVGCGSDGPTEPEPDPAIPNDVTFSPLEPTLIEGTTLSMSGTVLDQFGDPMPGESITWVTEDPLVFSVSQSGTITAVAPGSGTLAMGVRGRGGVATATVTVLGKFDLIASGALVAENAYNDETARWECAAEISVEAVGAFPGTFLEFQTSEWELRSVDGTVDIFSVTVTDLADYLGSTQFTTGEGAGFGWVVYSPDPIDGVVWRFRWRESGTGPLRASVVFVDC